MSTKILFLVPYPENESPSQRFRFEQYLPTLRDQKIEFKIQAFASPKNWKIFYSPGMLFKKLAVLIAGFLRRAIILLQVPEYDFIFIHREVTPIGPPVFEWIIANVLKKRIIYDFDDAIWMTEKANESPLLKMLKWRIKVKSICSWSYKISCGNLYLCDYAYRFNHNVFLNPTTIDTENLHNPDRFNRKNDNVITIGWTGSHSTLPYLALVRDVLQEIEREFDNLKIIIIADREPELGLKNMVFKPWSRESEIEDLYQFDIGIMPLSDDAWAKGKCGFKALQYMAMEIPAVASPVGVNSSIIDHQVDGFLAVTPAEWKAQLVELISDPVLRKSVGKLAREKVVRNYSVRSNRSNFLSLFT